MRILIVVAYFTPEVGSAAHTYADLARAFARRGHDVDVITSYPREFNLNAVDRSVKEFPLDETVDGVHIHRVKHPHTRDNIIIRGLEHFLLPHYYFKKYRELGKKFDASLFYLPPLPLYYIARKIRRRDNTPCVLNFQDFHPQELTDVGVLKNPLMIRVLEYIEREAYSKSDYITVLSHGGIDYIVKRGGNPDKISHIYNGILLSDLSQFFGKEDFKSKEHVEEKFLISYAGILSPFQGIDNILDVAGQLADNRDIVFYIVGDGMIKDHLAQRIRDEHLSNVSLMPLQPRDEYYNIVRSSDINLISLDERMKAPCVPGKTINLFASGRPVIAIVSRESETARVVRSIDPDLVIQPGDTAGLKKSILRLKNDEELRTIIGTKQQQFFEKNMNLEANVLVYERIFEQLSGRR
jgi:colanic acid biosynthesis glycosyl transferase WcaI